MSRHEGQATTVRRLDSVVRERGARAGLLRRILVATDGSDSGNRAVSFAFSIARTYGSALEICYALDYGRAFAECSNVNGSVGFLGPLVQELEESARSILAEASKRAKAAGIDVTSAVVSGRPDYAIVGRAIEREADAIVIGTSGRRGLDLFFLGSVADGVLRQSEVPTFVVPASDGSSFVFKRFLVAVDDSEPSVAAAAFALDLAKPVDARLTYNGVVETNGLSDDAVLYGCDPVPMLKSVRAATAARLAAEADRALTNDLLADCVVSEGAPAETILEVAKAREADVIVVGTHGRRGVRRLFLGSVAEAVVCRSRTPVVVVPARSVHAISLDRNG